MNEGAGRPTRLLAERCPDDRRLRLAFVLPIGEYYSREWSGAIATITRYLARELTGLGHSVSVLTSDDGGTMYAQGDVVRLHFGKVVPRGRLRSKVDTAVARLRKWTWPEYGPYWRAVSRTMRGLGWRPDAVIVANDPVTAARLAEGPEAPQVVLWLHNRLEGPEAVPLRNLPESVHVVAVSDAVRRWTRDRYLPRRPIQVIHSGIDTSAFRPRDSWLAVSDPVRVVCHGRIDPNKGHEAAAVAVQQLRAKGVPVELTVVGDVRTFGFSKAEEDAYRDRVFAAIDAAGGRRLGWVPHSDLPDELRRHDVACVLSRVDEPFGLVTLEAMASGCAIVATRMGGIPEAVGSAGALIEPDSPEQVAQIIEDWVTHRDHLNAMKRAAVTRAGEFAWAATAEGLLRVLTS